MFCKKNKFLYYVLATEKMYINKRTKSMDWTETRCFFRRFLPVISSVPDFFKINPLLTQSYKQFGNSVAVNVLKAIIKEIYNTGCFENKDKIHNKSFYMDMLSDPDLPVNLNKSYKKLHNTKATVFL